MDLGRTEWPQGLYTVAEEFNQQASDRVLSLTPREGGVWEGDDSKGDLWRF